MSDRDWADAPYVRVYQSIRRDEKFRAIYFDDRALSAWLRLLLEADADYPAPASIPTHLARYGREVLVKAGILHVTGRTYTLSGLAKERASRAMTPAERQALWRERHRNGRVTGESVSGVTENVTPSRNEPVTPRAGAGASASALELRNSSTEGGAGGNPDQPALMEAIAYIEERTRRPFAFGIGSKVWETLEPDVRDFGWPAVKAAMEAEKATFPDAAQLVFGATRRLHPISGPDKQGELDPDYVKRAVAAQRKGRPNGA